MRSLQRRLSLTAGAFALLAPGATLAQVHDRSVLPTTMRPASGVRFTSRVETYDVFGTTLNDLRRHLSTKRVQTRRGTRHAAMTSWDIRWRYARSRQTGIGWSPVGAEVFLEMVVTVPRWPHQFKMMRGLDDAPAFTSRSGG